MGGSAVRHLQYKEGEREVCDSKKTGPECTVPSISYGSCPQGGDKKVLILTGPEKTGQQQREELRITTVRYEPMPNSWTGYLESGSQP